MAARGAVPAEITELRDGFRGGAELAAGMGRCPSSSGQKRLGAAPFRRRMNPGLRWLEAGVA